MDLPRPTLSCDLDLPDAETIAFQWYVEHPHVRRPRRVLCAEDAYFERKDRLMSRQLARKLALIAFIALVVYWII